MGEREILDKLTEIVHICMPSTQDEIFTMDTVVNRDIGMDSMNFLYVVCKIEAAFDIHIPDRTWMKLSTMGDLVHTVQKALAKKK